MDQTKDPIVSDDRPNKWDRVGYSFLSVLISLVVLSTSIGGANFRDGAGSVLSVAVVTFIFGGCLCLIGWVLSLPFVILVKTHRGWHYWTMLAIGTCLGPLVFLLVDLYLSLENPTSSGFAPRSYYFLFLPTGVSLLSSLLYLFFVRRHDEHPRQRASSPKRIGFMTGRIEVSEDFDRLQNGEIEKLFDGRSGSVKSE
jgi:hypothetical protein